MDTKALRQKILDLAIRGKLVPQDPNDEPAEVLLERIREQKQQMFKEGKLKKKDIKNDTIIFKGEDNLHYEKFQDGTVKCIEDEIPFEVPEGWAWTRVQSITQICLGLTHRPEYVSKGVPFFSVKDISSGGLDISDPKYISKEEFANFPSGAKPQKGDILFGRVGTLGKPTVVNVDFDFGIFVSLGFFRKYLDALSSEYIVAWMDTSLFWNQVDINVKGAVLTNLNTGWLSKFLIPIPPLDEQKRISQKLNYLLEHESLIARNKEDIEGLIKQVKNKILDLAIRGQLVPQDPNDDPASVLLERIRTEKEELIKSGKIKREKMESIIFRGEDNSYYQQTGTLIENINDWNLDDIPINWELCCLGEICDYGNCVNVDTKDIDEEAWVLDLEDIEKDSGKVIHKIRKYERDSSSTKHLFKKGQVLYSKLRPYLNKVVLADEEGFCTSEILPLNFSNIVEPQYALYYLMSPTFLKYANRCSYGVKMPRLGTADGRKAIFPLPPFEEQRRISQHISKIFIEIDDISNMLL